jgi:ABC-2 type transport system permease protein
VTTTAERNPAEQLTTEPSPDRLPGLIAMSLSRGSLELKDYFRNKQAVGFTFALPILLFLLFGAIDHGSIGSSGVTARLYVISGIIGSAVMSATFASIGIDAAIERDEGTVKRIAGTPLPRTAYFAGKAITALVLAGSEAVILITLGALLFHLPLPSTPGPWLTLAWVFPLGVATCTILGLALSGATSNARSSSSLIQLAYLALQFISGVYFNFSSMPRWLQTVAAVFPLKWLCQGLRSVFLPASFAAYQPGHSYQHGLTAAILAGWLVVGLVLALRTFHWRQD